MWGGAEETDGLPLWRPLKELENEVLTDARQAAIARQDEEYRRLLYVAMTRAKQSLTLIAPLRFHVTQQARDGDRHVYGARSRFVTEPLLGTLKQCWHGRSEATSQDAVAVSGRQLDAAARMREMWG